MLYDLVIHLITVHLLYYEKFIILTDVKATLFYLNEIYQQKLFYLQYSDDEGVPLKGTICASVCGLRGSCFITYILEK